MQYYKNILLNILPNIKVFIKRPFFFKWIKQGEDKAKLLKY